MLVCAQCGRENAEDSRFCSGCASPLGTLVPAQREERKVVTILFADLVGFTSRAEQLDPEDVRATLSPYYARLRAELERHGGTVEKFIGDAVMAVFGAPVAHEDDPERAVRAALAIRDAIAEDGRLQVRIAVTTGEALVTLDAKPGQGEGVAAGDVVNTAARLQSAAPVNGILVGEAAYRATRQAIEYREADAVDAKGKTEPVPVWEAVEARAHFGVDTLQTGAELIGRRRELDLLADALGRARQERAPQLVTLVGVPGIGKSRLVYELSRLVDAESELITWRQGRSLPYGEGVTYWALGEMAKAQAGILETDSPEEAERKLSAMVADLVPDEAHLVEDLRPLVGLGTEADPGSGGRAERFAAWRQFFEALAEQRPTVLVFEDLHWADDNLLDFIDHLVDWAGGVPLLVVCTTRPELLDRRAGWGGGKPNSLALSISPLSDEETSQLLVRLLERSVIPVETQSALLARAGGNPLYAEQFARLLDESGSAEDLAVPENVQGIIAARLDGLQPDEKHLLQDAAVLGKVFWLGAVCAVGERDRPSAEEWLHGLERKEFVRRERRSTVGDETEYAFRHVLVLDVAYGQIPRGERAQRHERAAAWIEELGRQDQAEMLAHHYLEALRLSQAAGHEQGPELKKRARHAAREAGDRALGLGAFLPARRFYEAAIELSPADDQERPELLLHYARTRANDTSLDDGVLDEAAEGLLRGGKPEQAAEAHVLHAIIWWTRADNDRMYEHLNRARELVEDRPTSPLKAYVLQQVARRAMVAEDFEVALELGTTALQMAEELGLDDLRARTLNTLGVSRVYGGDFEGLRDLEQAVEIASAVHSDEEWTASLNLAWSTASVGDLKRAWELHEQSRRVADRLGLDAFIAWDLAEHAIQCYWRGRWDEAIAAAEEFLEASGESRHYMETSCRGVTAAIQLARGNLESALAEASRGTEISRGTKDPQTLFPALALEGRLRLAVGETQGAHQLANELLTAWEERGVRPLNESADGAWLFHDLDRADEFLVPLAAAPAQTLWHEAARAIVTGEFASAAETYAEIGCVPFEAYARLRAAEQLVGQGRRPDADAQLRTALPMLEELGATAWIAKGEALRSASA